MCANGRGVCALLTFTIGGFVLTGEGVGVGGVDVAGNNGASSAVTAADGAYSITVPNHWSGTIAAAKPGWLITPPSKTYTSVSADIAGENYTAEYWGITVKKDGTGDFPSIQSAINYAVNGDEIIVYPGTYLERISFGGKNIIVRSTSPENPSIVNTTIIDANGSGTVVTFSGPESSTCTLAGLTITGGYSQRGAGIYGGAGTEATIQYCIIRNNSGYFSTTYNNASSYGGGLYRCNGTIQNCTITNNSVNSYSSNPYTAYSYGGGLYECNGTIEYCTITNNSAYSTSYDGSAYSYGGGLYKCDGTIQNCVITDNSARCYSSSYYTAGFSC